MRLRKLRVIVTLVLLTCTVCPLVETFDRWDHTLQTGNDTEYALVVLALCVGVSCAFAQFIYRFSLGKLAAEIVSEFCAHAPCLSAACSSSSVVPVTESPPPLALRI